MRPKDVSQLRQASDKASFPFSGLQCLLQINAIHVWMSKEKGSHSTTWANLNASWWNAHHQRHTHALLEMHHGTSCNVLVFGSRWPMRSNGDAMYRHVSIHHVFMLHFCMSHVFRVFQPAYAIMHHMYMSIWWLLQIGWTWRRQTCCRLETILALSNPFFSLLPWVFQIAKQFSFKDVERLGSKTRP